MLLLSLACATPAPSDTGDPGVGVITDYVVDFQTEPDPLVAGEAGTFHFQITDQDGAPIEDLQTTHERMAHVQFVSGDLTSFQHLHHEDYAPLTGEDLRDADFEFPVTVPLAGDYRVVFDFAHLNAYLAESAWLTAAGSPAQAAAPDLTPNDVATDHGVTGTLTWDAPAVPGYEASFSVHLVDEAGVDVTDLVQYLGADAHAFLTTSDLAWTAHTHAWFPDMENVAPGHPMPQVYVGPDLPFHYVLPAPGTYKAWIQLTRGSAPDVPIVLVYTFVVAG